MNKAIILAFIATLSACSGLQEYASAPSSGPALTADKESYRLSVGDKVRVTVYNEPTLSGEYVVAQDRMISFPLIGDIPAESRTSAELSRAIATKLSDGYLNEPDVSSEVVTFRPFYILGEVGKPGEYAYQPGMTVLQAVASAEGFTYRANKRRILIKRAGSDKEVAVDITASLAVYPGDTIRIAERYF